MAKETKKPEDETKNEEVQAETNEETKAEDTSTETVAVQEKPAAAKPKVKNTMEAVETELLVERLSVWQDEDAKKQNKMQEARFPEFVVGDTIKVFVKIKEGKKERIQPYQGVVIGMKHGGVRKSFTVRRISHEVAIERVFPFYSPYIEKIEVIRHGQVRRAKLYYLRGRFGKSARIREKVNFKSHSDKKKAK